MAITTKDLDQKLPLSISRLPTKTEDPSPATLVKSPTELTSDGNEISELYNTEFLPMELEGKELEKRSSISKSPR